MIVGGNPKVVLPILVTILLFGNIIGFVLVVHHFLKSFFAESRIITTADTIENLLVIAFLMGAIILMLMSLCDFFQRTHVVRKKIYIGLSLYVVGVTFLIWPYDTELFFLCGSDTFFFLVLSALLVGARDLVVEKTHHLGIYEVKR